MVKNFGGNKSKKLGRKYVNMDLRNTKKLRIAEDKEEVYAIVVKLYGNGMCNVKCIDGKERLCIIRKKFKGRNKRHNNVESGSWVLVGLRDWESSNDNKQPKCDLLEVYSDNEKEKLKKTEDEFYFKDFISVTNENIRSISYENDQDNWIEFEDSKSSEYERLMNDSSSHVKLTRTQSNSIVETSESSSDAEFNIDDI
jgi:initiation factor 1A